VFGLAPLAAGHATLGEALKSAGKQVSAGAMRPRLRAALAGAQLTLALVLLVSAGLLLKSFVRLLATDLGFRPEGIVVLAARIPETYGWNDERRGQFRQLLVEKVRSVAGVQEAAAAGAVPFLGETRRGLVSMEGDAPQAPSAENTMVVTGRLTPQENAGLRQASLPEVDPDYFRVMGTPTLAGDSFASTRDGVIVNQSFVKRFLGGNDPIGRRIKPGPANTPGEWKRIIGVVGDMRPALDREPGPVVYFSNTPQGGSLSWVVARTAGAPPQAAREILRAARSLDSQAGFQVFTMDELLSRHVAPQRFRTTLVSVFAAVAVALALVGLYGVMSYLVAQRTYELGVRLALGARPGQIFGLVLGHGARVVTAGTLAGALLALGVTRYLGSLLHQVSPRDATTFALVPALLAAVALTACVVPARRAVRIDPAEVLRSDT
jgi:predicted permease